MAVRKMLSSRNFPQYPISTLTIFGGFTVSFCVDDIFYYGANMMTPDVNSQSLNNLLSTACSA